MFKLLYLVTHNMMRTYKGNLDFSEINFNFATNLDISKCLKQTELSILFHTGAPFSELPSNISIMVHIYYIIEATLLLWISGVQMCHPSKELRGRVYNFKHIAHTKVSMPLNLGLQISITAESYYGRIVKPLIKS